MSIVGELETRIMIFSKGFQDLLEEVMKMKAEKKQLMEQLDILKGELTKIRAEVKGLKPKSKTKAKKSTQSQQSSTRASRVSGKQQAP